MLVVLGKNLVKQQLTPDMPRPRAPAVVSNSVSPSRSISPINPHQGNRILLNTVWVNWQYEKPVKAVTKLMLMLAEVNAFLKSHYQTPI